MGNQTNQPRNNQGGINQNQQRPTTGGQGGQKDQTLQQKDKFQQKNTNMNPSKSGATKDKNQKF